MTSFLGGTLGSVPDQSPASPAGGGDWAIAAAIGAADAISTNALHLAKFAISSSPSVSGSLPVRRTTGVVH